MLALLIWWQVPDGTARPGIRRVAAGDGERWYHGFAAVVRNRGTWPGFWVNFGLSGVNMSFVGCGRCVLSTNYGMTPLVASQHTSLMLAGYACSTGVVGWWSDRMERRRPILIVSGVVISCAGCLVCGRPGEFHVMRLRFVMGVVFSGSAVVGVCEGSERAALRRHGHERCNIGGFVAAGNLQPLVGWVIDASEPGDFRPALAVLAIFSTTGLAVRCLYTRDRCRYIGRR